MMAMVMLWLTSFLQSIAARLTALYFVNQDYRWALGGDSFSCLNKTIRRKVYISCRKDSALNASFYLIDGSHFQMIFLVLELACYPEKW